MDYEKKIKEILQNEEINDDFRYKLAAFFPELKESEDEKKKRILLSISSKMSFHLRDIFTEEEFQCFNAWSYAWLEKQGEREPVVVIPKFRVGDVIRPKGSTAEYTIESISGECYHGKGWGLHISGEDDYELVEQKPAWSEEDEKFLDGIIANLEYLMDRANSDTLKQSLQKRIDWLKSLRPQNTWKPSDEQMTALRRMKAAIAGEGEIYVPLNSLYEDLKKLKE
jgi:hypothetical protein